MLYSLNILRSLAPLPSDYHLFQQKLIASLFEIEYGEIQRSYDNLTVIGFVKDVYKHPNADTLQVCQVDCGTHGIFQICTWWENITSWQYVIVALPWSHLKAINLSIGARKMRGEDSNGMICSKSELGIHEDEDKHRIWDMSQDMVCDPTMIGKSINEVLPRMTNTMFEVESVAITNRPDLRWHQWVAIESQALFHESWFNDTISSSIIHNTIQQAHKRTPSTITTLPSYQSWWIQKGDNIIVSNIQTPLCAYYGLTYLKDITCEPSVFTGRVSLMDSGYTPKLNWIDFGNYMMSLTGQPVHLFDANNIQWSISVKQAQWGELFTDLTQSEHILESWDIIICDDTWIIALAWIIGWNTTQVTNKTISLLIETASFDPIQIRKTSTRLWLKTQAAIRYEKWINPSWTGFCHIQMVQLINDNHIQYQTWMVHQTYAVIPNSWVFTIPSIELNPTQTIYYLVWESHHIINEWVILDCLNRLWYNVDNSISSCRKIKPGIWRSDVTLVQDIYEDLARHIGLDHIPQSPSSLTPTRYNQSMLEFSLKLSTKLVHTCKYTQIETYPWYHESWIHLLWLDTTTHIEQLNPMDSSTPWMRQSMVPRMLQVAHQNYRQDLPINIMELGKVFHYQPHESVWTKLNNTIQSTTKLTALHIHTSSDNRKNDPYLTIQHILNTVWYEIKRPYILTPSSLNRLHPTKQSFIIMEWKTIGVIGQIHPSLLTTQWFQETIIASMIELDIDQLYTICSQKKLSGSSYLQIADQLIIRDLSFELPIEKQFNHINELFSTHPSIIHHEIIDLYCAPWSWVKSMTIRFTLKGDGTRTNDTINETMNNLIKKAESTWAILKWIKLL